MGNPNPDKYICNPITSEALLKQANEEINYENWRVKVEQTKHKLLTYKPWYVKLFPFKVKIERI